MIKFTVKGNPIALKRHRSTRSGRMYDPSAKDKKQIWLQIARFKPKRPQEGNIQMIATFYTKRPKSHYRSGKYKHILKDNAPEYNKSRADLDNYIKMIMDIIQGKNRFIIDDSQICRIQAEKVYDEKPRTEIIIEEIS